LFYFLIFLVLFLAPEPKKKALTSFAGMLRRVYRPQSAGVPPE
jgi:hypothetical protein